MPQRAAGAALCALLWLQAPAGAQTLHHDLNVTIEPGAARLTVEDAIRLPPALAAEGRLRVRLNAGFGTPAVEGARLVSAPHGGGRVREHLLELAPGSARVRLRYAGTPRLAPGGDGAAEWFDARGAHLGAGAAWYPRVADALFTFELQVRVPDGWRALAPGRGGGENGVWRWSAGTPVEDLDLVAGPLVEYARDEPFGRSLVWLRQPEPELAHTYLDAVGRHLPFYAQLIGPYPHAKFAVVENLRPTGWGMPSFTLLGARVMRLPFIPDTSLPHEVLHNWWGNGVLVDLASGNWSEGLTAYLADHLLAERRGGGAHHRRDALARFRSAGPSAPAPVDFVARHDRRSQTAGYDKPLMIFHMARRALGDAAFVAALRDLYRDGLGRRVGAPEVLQRLAPAGEDWFDTWWTRTGAPRLALACCRVSPHADGFRVEGVLRQTQPGPAWPLRVPVQVLASGETVAGEHVVAMGGTQQPFRIDLPTAPQVLAVDAAFDLMRVPDRDELPPSLGEALDAGNAVALIAPALPAPLAAAYRALAARVQARVVDEPPPVQAGAVWLLGRGAGPAGEDWAALETAVPSGDSRVQVFREPGGRPRVRVEARSAAAATALAAKLPHYGRYGLLGFEGDGARNVLKSEQAPAQPPLRVVLDPSWKGPELPLPARPALTAP